MSVKVHKEPRVLSSGGGPVPASVPKVDDGMESGGTDRALADADVRS